MVVFDKNVFTLFRVENIRFDEQVDTATQVVYTKLRVEKKYNFDLMTRVVSLTSYDSGRY